MFKRKNKRLFGLFLFVCLFAAPRAEANPIACQEFHAVRSGNQVVLELDLWKSCYDSAPTPEEALLMRDLFVMDVDFQLSEDDFSYYLTAIDEDVSGNKHYYVVSFESLLLPSMSAVVDGPDCAFLDVDLGENETILEVSLKSECIADPSAGLEYIVTRYSEVLHPLEWSELDAGSHMECTAIHYYDYDGGHIIYEVGVRSGDDTFYAKFRLLPNENEDPEDQMQADGGKGCNVGGNSNSGHLPLFLLLFAPLLFWRRRKTG